MRLIYIAEGFLFDHIYQLTDRLSTLQVQIRFVLFEVK